MMGFESATKTVGTTECSRVGQVILTVIIFQHFSTQSLRLIAVVLSLTSVIHLVPRDREVSLTMSRLVSSDDYLINRYFWWLQTPKFMAGRVAGMAAQIYGSIGCQAHHLSFLNVALRK